MKTEITRPTWEDVVFESRNKGYGAYSIRKSYDENVSKASLIAFCLAAIVFGALQIASLMHIDIKVPTHIISGRHPLPVPDIIVDQTKPKNIDKADHKINRDLQVQVVNHDVIEAPPVKPIETTQTGSETGTTSVQVDGINTGNPESTLPAAVEVPKIFMVAEVMPQYEGGLQAMVRFLSRNINYPPSARSMGQEGTVYVRFVVNDGGQVVDVDVVKGVCAVLDREAMRVVALMKKWKPGFQNNLPVNVRMVLPIKFELER